MRELESKQISRMLSAWHWVPDIMKESMFQRCIYCCEPIQLCFWSVVYADIKEYGCVRLIKDLKRIYKK